MKQTPWYQVIEIHRRYPATLETYYDERAVIDAADAMAVKRGNLDGICFDTAEEAFAYLHDDLSSAVILDTQSEDYLKDWQIAFDRCQAGNGSAGRNPGSHIQELLLEALNAVWYDLDSPQDTLARAVLVAAGRRGTGTEIESEMPSL